MKSFCIFDINCDLEKFKTFKGKYCKLNILSQSFYLYLFIFKSFNKDEILIVILTL